MKHPTFRQKQQGAVLIVSLLFLVILTMLGITAMTGTTFEERMAGNARDAAIAHHAAEAALREARDEILLLAKSGRDVHVSVFGTADTATGTCAGRAGLCNSRVHSNDWRTVPPEIPADVDWTSDASTAKYGKTSGRTLPSVSKAPRYIAELLCIYLQGGEFARGQLDACRIYRFTAVGWGKNPNTQVTVQEIYIGEEIK